MIQLPDPDEYFVMLMCGTVRAGSHPGLLFKKLGKVMRFVSAANLFRNNLNFSPAAIYSFARVIRISVR